MFAGTGLTAGGALLAELTDRGQAALAYVVLALLVIAAGCAGRRAWRQRAWLPLGMMLSAPVAGVALWLALALQEALRSA
jgi:hypothetical protein